MSLNYLSNVEFLISHTMEYEYANHITLSNSLPVNNTQNTNLNNTQQLNTSHRINRRQNNKSDDMTILDFLEQQHVTKLLSIRMEGKEDPLFKEFESLRHRSTQAATSSLNRVNNNNYYMEDSDEINEPEDEDTNLSPLPNFDLNRGIMESGEEGEVLDFDSFPEEEPNDDISQSNTVSNLTFLS